MIRTYLFTGLVFLTKMTMAMSLYNLESNETESFNSTQISSAQTSSAISSSDQFGIGIIATLVSIFI